MTTLLILAAGMGSRYGGLKQLDPVGPSSEVMLDYSVRDAIRAGFEKLVFVIRRDFEAEFREKVLSRYEGQIATEVVYQEIADLPNGLLAPSERKKPWGTGHAIWCARKKVSEPFLVVNADDFYGADAYSVMAGFLRRVSHEDSQACAMVAYPLCNTLSEHGPVSRGVCTVSREGLLLKVEEFTGIRREPNGTITGTDTKGLPQKLVGTEMVSMNFWGFSPHIFQHLEGLFKDFLRNGGLNDVSAEFYIPSAVTCLLDSKATSVSVLASSGRWLGVTYREDRAAVAAEIAAMYP